MCVALPFHRPGSDQVGCSRQPARKGPAVSAGLTPLTHEAVFFPRPGGDYGRCSRPCAQGRASRLSRLGISYVRCSAIVPAASTPGTAISACEKGQQRQQVSHLSCSMQRLAVAPGGSTCCAAVRAREKGQRDQQALQLSRARQRHVAVPDGFTCWAAVRAGEKAQLCQLDSRQQFRQADDHLHSSAGRGSRTETVQPSEHAIEPAVPAGITSLTSDAAPRHRAGCDHTHSAAISAGEEVWRCLQASAACWDRSVSGRS